MIQAVACNERGNKMDLGTSLGLGLASGLNAYFPLLALALAARWLHVSHVNVHFAFITSDWCLLALAVLTLADVVADKVPVVDHIWDTTQTVVRPLAGALVAVAAYSHPVPLLLTLGSIPVHLLNGGDLTRGVQSMEAGLLVIALVGGILALMAHTAKATTRLISTITTAGILNVLLSLGEDLLVFLAILLSLLLPTLMLLLIVLFVLSFGRTILRAWSHWLKTRAGW
jgi:hypothetical protein